MAQADSEQFRSEEEVEIDLRQILKVLRKWSRFIIGMTLLVGLAAGLVSYFVLTPIYQADTLLRFTQVTDKLQANPNQPVSAGTNVDTFVQPVLTMNTHLAQIKSRAMMQRVIDELDLRTYTPDALAAIVDASIVKDSNLIQVKVTSSKPAIASLIANALSDQYLQLMNEKSQEQISSSVTFLTNQKQLTEQQLIVAQTAIKKYPAKPTGTALVEQADLQREIDRLKQTSETLNKQISDTLIAKSVDLGDSSMVIMSAAAVPISPIKPNKTQNVLIALVLGFMIFTLLAFVLEYLDNTVKTPEDFREMQLSVLGVIPTASDNNRRHSAYGG